jgi:hypothetical protein
MADVHERFAELATQFRNFAEANSSEASGCVARQELRKAACQGAAQAYTVAAEMVEERLQNIRAGGRSR